MPSLSAYKSDLDYSYAPGIFPSMECLMHRPEITRRVLIHSSAAGREGTDRLRALAEAERKTATQRRYSKSLKTRRIPKSPMWCCIIPETAGMWEPSCGQRWDWALRMWH